jgi:glyoxylase-like metal-dependent hydrolase (beta-lactamase superfamily II)
MRILDHLHAFLWRSASANNCNTYLIDGPQRVLIDPGHRALFGHVAEGLRSLGTGPAGIDLVLGTHGHPDHLEAVPLLRGGKSLFALHSEEWRWIETAGKPMAAALGIDLDDCRPDFFLGEGTLEVAGLKFEVLHTPGHSPGSICLYWPEHKALFTGDLVFQAGIGRTDLSGGNGAQLRQSIERLTALDVDWLLPGHGEPVSGAAAVRRNFEQIAGAFLDYI